VAGGKVELRRERRCDQEKENKEPEAAGARRARKRGFRINEPRAAPNPEKNSAGIAARVELSG
jgi:hypothetical protein